MSSKQTQREVKNRALELLIGSMVQAVHAEHEGRKVGISPGHKFRAAQETGRAMVRELNASISTHGLDPSSAEAEAARAIAVSEEILREVASFAALLRAEGRNAPSA